MPVGTEEQAQITKEAAPVDKPLPPAVRLPPTIDHTKDIISSCVYNVQFTAQTMNSVIGYTNCLKGTSANADGQWPNIAACANLKPPTVAAPTTLSVPNLGTGKTIARGSTYGAVTTQTDVE